MFVMAGLEFADMVGDNLFAANDGKKKSRYHHVALLSPKNVAKRNSINPLVAAGPSTPGKGLWPLRSGRAVK